MNEPRYLGVAYFPSIMAMSNLSAVSAILTSARRYAYAHELRKMSPGPCSANEVARDSTSSRRERWMAA
jgi:hypothetical protein